MSIVVGQCWSPAKSGPVWSRILVVAPALAAGLVAMSVVYAVATYLIPLACLNVFGTILLGVATGTVVGKALTYMRIHSRLLALPLIVAAPLFVHLVGWLTWVFVVLFARTEMGPLEAALVTLWPPSFVEAVGQINEVGVWTVTRRGGTGAGQPSVHGTWLWVTWFIEAAIVLVAGWVTGFLEHGDERGKPTCGACGQALVERPEVLRLPLEMGSDSFVQRVRALDLGVLESDELPRGSSWFQVDLATCPCGASSTLALSRVQMGMGDRQVTPHVAHLGVAPEHVEYIDALAARFRAAQAAAFYATQAPGPGGPQ